MILHEKCDPKLADDTKLPYTAYLVQYEIDGAVYHDLTVGGAAVELFDHYYDKFKKDFVRLFQSEGRANPKLWNNPADKPKEEPRKRRRRQG